MPELPLVERFRSEAERYARGRRVERARSVVDDMMMPGLSPRRFAAALAGRRVMAVERRGKFLWLRFDQPPHLVMHFGMTGELLYGKYNRPKHWRIELTLTGGRVLTLVDPRRFGRVVLVREPLLEPPVSELGFDPWLDPIGPAAFTRAVQARSAPIKAILLDQTFAAGVGNWIADEVLHLARIDPRRPGRDLSSVECRRVHRQLLAVVRLATEAGSREEHFPRHWLFHLRWGRNTGLQTVRGQPVKFEVVAGRSTAWVPLVQV